MEKLILSCVMIALCAACFFIPAILAFQVGAVAGSIALTLCGICFCGLIIVDFIKGLSYEQ